MANTDKPMGMKPISHINGSPWNGMFRMYYKAAGLSEAIFVGSPVKSAGSADSTGKYPTIQLAGTDPIRGVVIGFAKTPYGVFDATDLDLKYSPSDTAHYVAVVDDPSVIFEMQEDSSTALTVTEIGLNASPTTESGSTTTGLSSVEIDCSTENTTSTLSLKILRLLDREDNELGDYAKFEVLINSHELGQGLGSTGV
ncbi:MAG: hypothetical protein U9N82_03435 [Thermodesulfobacteriota bacterium]|nr:hypothetical protein [Thermodesulfobacteriota bacterium]